jgi:hypothetical protein
MKRTEGLVFPFTITMMYFRQLDLCKRMVHHGDTEDTERTGFSLWWEIPPKGKISALRAKSSDDLVAAGELVLPCRYLPRTDLRDVPPARQKGKVCSAYFVPLAKRVVRSPSFPNCGTVVRHIAVNTCTYL